MCRAATCWHRALHAELSNDLKAAVDPNWRMRNLRSANFGELNPTHNPETPAVLLEIAYHDESGGRGG